MPQATPTWETVTADRDSSTYTDRLAVPGGWLYRCTKTLWGVAHPNIAISTTFVPDPSPRTDALSLVDND